MTNQQNEELVKITSGGTISIPKQFRKFLELQKGDYVKVIMSQDHLIIKKVVIT
jgi:AbrB family looped-hinge helix DNA binding protein